MLVCFPARTTPSDGGVLSGSKLRPTGWTIGGRGRSSRLEARSDYRRIAERALLRHEICRVCDELIERGDKSGLALVELVDNDETPTGDCYRLTDGYASAFRADAEERAQEAENNCEMQGIDCIPTGGGPAETLPPGWVARSRTVGSSGSCQTRYRDSRCP